jgi:uncharacterized protein
VIDVTSYAVVIVIDVADVEGEAGIAALRQQIVPAISALPGFRSGVWLARDEDGCGVSLTVWSSEQEARAMADQYAIGARPQEGASVVSCQVREVAAVAGGSSVVWFEAPAADSHRSQAFYGQLLGWQFQPYGEQDYHVSSDAGGAIHGAADQKGILAYFGVEDVDGARGRVLELGGSAGEVQEIPGVGRYLHCTDTEGNSFGLYQDGAAA